jgi:predicted nucleic acid-binding protein
MRVYLDTMVWIYAIEGKTDFTSVARGLFSSLSQSPHTILVSHFLVAELLVLPIREDDRFTIARYRRALLSSPATQLVPFQGAAALSFARLRAAHRVKPPDAIHLALAASVHADAFITTDTRLGKLTIAGIGLIGDLSTPLS